MPRPSRMPIAPPNMHSITASLRNCDKMLSGRAPTAIRRPISRVRSVTETSMMFMMPTPPTTSEITATNNSSSDIVADWLAMVLVISVMSRTLKSSGIGVADVMPLVEQLGDLFDGQRNFLGRFGLDHDLIDVDESHRLRRVGGFGRGEGRIEIRIGPHVRIGLAGRVADRSTGGAGGTARPARAARGLVGDLGTDRADAKFDRGPGGENQIVLIHAEHVGALAAQHAEHAERHALHPHVLADRRLVAEKIRDDGLPQHANGLLVAHVAVGEARALGHVAPIADIEKCRRAAVDVHRHPVLIAVDDLRAARAPPGRRCVTAGHSCAIASPSCGVSVTVLPLPKLTPPLVAVPGMTSNMLAPMLAIVC